MAGGYEGDTPTGSDFGTVTVSDAAVRYWWLVLAVTAALVAAVIGGAALLREAGVVGGSATARATILVEDPVTAGAVVGTTPQAQRYAADQLAVLRSELVAARAIAASGLDGVTVDDVRDGLTAVGAPDTSAIELSYTGKDRAEATSMLSAVIDAYEGVVADRDAASTERSLASIDTQIQSLQEQLQTLEASSIGVEEKQQSAATVRQLISGLAARRAEVVSARDVPRVTVLTAPERESASSAQEALGPLRLFSAVLLGLVLGVGAAYVLCRRRPRYTDASTSAASFDAPLLGELRRADHERPSDTPVVSAPSSATAEALRAVSLRLDQPGGHAGHMHGVVGVPGQHPATLVARNLADATAARGARVVVLETAPGGNHDGDGDHDVHSVTTHDLAEGMRPVPASSTRVLRIEDAGSDECNLDALERFVQSVRANSDVVLVVLPTTDVRAAHLRLLRHLDDIVVVVQEGAPARPAATSREWMTSSGVPVAGVVYDRYFALAG